MNQFLLFYMWEPFRKSIIKSHCFYIEQSKKLLLSQFNDIGSISNQATQDWIQENSLFFDPDRDDPDEIYERANDFDIEFYIILSELRNQTYLNVVAGMFYNWDKALRSWLVTEVRSWHSGDMLPLEIWSVDFGKIFDLLECFGWNVRSTDYFRKLNACRLVVNVYKHGNGKAFEILQKNFPEYLNGTFLKDHSLYADHSNLIVTDNHIQEFSNAIIAFWSEFPEKIFDSGLTEIPDWFDQAISKDHSKIEKMSKK